MRCSVIIQKIQVIAGSLYGEEAAPEVDKIQLIA